MEFYMSQFRNILLDSKIWQGKITDLNVPYRFRPSIVVHGSDSINETLFFDRYKSYLHSSPADNIQSTKRSSQYFYHKL